MEETLIKPSSPTQPHLLNHKICLLDQFIPPQYVPVVLFYSAGQLSEYGSIADVSGNLKTSLSETLSDYYPFAGRLNRGNFLVECNDEGALFVEEQMSHSLSEFLENPDISRMSCFLPFSPFKYVMNSDKEVVLGVKLSVFRCGGVGIGVCVSHKVADGQSTAVFLKSWSERALKMVVSACKVTTATTIAPRFDAWTVFRPKDSFDPPLPIDVSQKEKIVSKMFRFVGIGQKTDALFQNVNPNPSRVEAITALIWEAASKAKNHSPSTAVHMVNVRARADPPLPENVIGNLFQYSVARNLTGREMTLRNLVEILRQSIASIDSDYVRSLQGEEGFSHACESIAKSVELAGPTCGMEVFTFSSWIRFPFYEIDFGWGKPTWVGTDAVPMKNVVVLMGTRLGDGIEAYVTLGEDEMGEFEADTKLMQFLKP